MKKPMSEIKNFAFTCFHGGVGKSFAAINFAKSLKKTTGKPVVIVEYNMLTPSVLCEFYKPELVIKTSFLDYYMSNWSGVKADEVEELFTSEEGVFYVPFCGNRPSKTLQPIFNLNETDLLDSVAHFIELFNQIGCSVVFDIAMQLSPVPIYLLSRLDVLMYVYTSQAPSPAYAYKFLEEVKRRRLPESKILWLRNHVDPETEEPENQLFENEFSLPIGGEISGTGSNDNLEQRFVQLVEKADAMPAIGSEPDADIESVKKTPDEIIEYRKALRMLIVGDMEKKFGISDDELRKTVEANIDEAFKNNPIPRIDGYDSEFEVKKYLIDEILGLGPLEEFMRDEEVDEIMVNGPDKIFVERNGKLVLTERKFSNSEHVRTVIERILMPVGRTVNERTPYVDARLSDGSRVHAIIPPLSLTGPMITIRRFAKNPYTMEDLVYRFKTLSPNLAEFIKLCVHFKKNIIVSGGASSGKTTLLNVLSNYILPSERVICIEDSAELRLNQSNLGRLEARQQGTEAKTQVSIRDLVRNALRMRPDRIIVGECRGAEALDMLQAMNTGHDGSLTTLHANTPRDALSRLETMVLMAGVDLPLRAIREQIASSVNIVIQNGRLADGNRKLLEVVEVTGIEDTIIKTETIFKFEKKWIDSDGHVVGEIVPTGYIPKFMRLISGDFIKKHAYLFEVDDQKKSNNKSKTKSKKLVKESN